MSIWKRPLVHDAASQLPLGAQYVTPVVLDLHWTNLLPGPVQGDSLASRSTTEAAALRSSHLPLWQPVSQFSAAHYGSLLSLQEAWMEPFISAAFNGFQQGVCFNQKFPQTPWWRKLSPVRCFDSVEKFGLQPFQPNSFCHRLLEASFSQSLLLIMWLKNYVDFKSLFDILLYLRKDHSSVDHRLFFSNEAKQPPTILRFSHTASKPFHLLWCSTLELSCCFHHGNQLHHRLRELQSSTYIQEARNLVI